MGFPGEGPYEAESASRPRGWARNQWSRDRISFVTCNATTWPSVEREFENSDGFVHRCHIIAVAEHRLPDERRRARAQNSIEKFGWKGFFTESAVGEKGGTSSGVALLWRNYMHLSDVGLHVNTPRALSASVEISRLGQVEMLSVYGWVDDQHKTLALLEVEKLRLLASGRPWVIFGDFNIPAEAMRQWLREVGNWGAVIDAGPSCYSGEIPSAIDFFIVQPGMEVVMSDVRLFDSGLATHKPVGITVKGGAQGRVRVLCKNGRAAVKPVFGPSLAPDTLSATILAAQSRAAVARWAGNSISAAPSADQRAELDRMHEAWNEEARNQAAQVYGQEFGQAGGPLQYEWKRPCDIVRDKLPRQTNALFASTWLLRRVKEVARTGNPSGTEWWREWTNQIAAWRRKGVLGSASLNLFLSIWTTPTYAADHIREKAKHLLGYFEALREKHVQKEREASDARWKKFKKDVELGVSAGFRLVKSKTVEAWSGEVGNVANAALIERNAGKWGEIWQAQQHLGHPCVWNGAHRNTTPRTDLGRGHTCEFTKLQGSNHGGRGLASAKFFGFVGHGFGHLSRHLASGGVLAPVATC